MHVNPRITALLEGMNHPSLPGIDLSLDRMWQLLAALGNPQEKLPPVIHVAGTNGKGSTIAYLQAIYTAGGYRVHRYTSPHLVAFNERIVLAGATIEDAPLQEYLERVHAACKTIPATFFEATTAAAFLAFSEHAADVLLLETGLGGRLDATNVVAQPIATILTPIDLDHREFLGDSLSKIAGEKAGILKAEVPCFTAPQTPEVMQVVQGRAQQFGCVLQEAPRLDPQLPIPALAGEHQKSNAALAAATVRGVVAHLPVTEAAIHTGITQATWPARLQKLTYGPLVDAWGMRGDVVLDGGHNVHAARAIAQWVAAQPQDVRMICGMMKRKDAQAYFAALQGVVTELVCIPIPHATDFCSPEALKTQALNAGILNVRIAEDAVSASYLWQDSHSATLLIAGSLYLAGELLKKHG